MDAAKFKKFNLEKSMKTFMAGAGSVLILAIFSLMAAVAYIPEILMAVVK